jgi:hypothetical protein
VAGKGKAQYRYVATYAGTLASGQPVEPGEFVKLSEEEAEENEALLAEGHLVGTGEVSEAVAEKAERRVARQEEKEG